MDGGGGGEAARPVALHPYQLTSSAQAPASHLVHSMALTPTLALSDISWCQLPGAYSELRTVEGQTYETDMTLAYNDLAAGQKYDTIKYEYGDLRKFDEPRLYHKEETTIIKQEEEEKDEKGETTPVKRGRPTENPCWNYFIRLDDQNVRCRLCSKVVKSACATNMTKHLERHHQHDYQHLIVQIKQYRSQKGPSSHQQDQIACVGEPYLKTEPYDIYSTDSVVAHSYGNGYERTETGVWPRTQWNPWSMQLDPSTSNIDARTGVITHSSMATQSWTSPPGPSVAAEKPYIKRNRKTEHPVWEYFKRTDDGNAQCAICQGVVKSPCSSNFMRHLMRHHTTEYNNVYVKWVQKRGPHK